MATFGLKKLEVSSFEDGVFIPNSIDLDMFNGQKDFTFCHTLDLTGIDQKEIDKLYVKTESKKEIRVTLNTPKIIKVKGKVFARPFCLLVKELIGEVKNYDFVYETNQARFLIDKVKTK